MPCTRRKHLARLTHGQKAPRPAHTTLPPPSPPTHRYGASAVKSLKVVLAIDSEQEFFVVNELQQWNFFGLHAHNVVILPLPRFHGFAQVRPQQGLPAERPRRPQREPPHERADS